MEREQRGGSRLTVPITLPNATARGRTQDGVALTERDSTLTMQLPDQIFIFRGPLLDFCDTEEQLVEEVRITVVHEVAHHFGIDDRRLHELGYA